MNRRIAAVVAAAVLVGGLLVLVVPQHAVSVVRTLAATVVVVTGGLVLVAIAPLVGREPPATRLDRSAPRRVTPLDPHGLRDARRDLGRPSASESVPPPVWERLVVAATLRFQASGIDLDAPRSRDDARSRVTPATWALLTTRPTPGTRRDSAGVADIVHRTLDELDQLTPGGTHGNR